MRKSKRAKRRPMAMSWEEYEPPKKQKKRYKSYKRGFERSRYARGKSERHQN